MCVIPHLKEISRRVRNFSGSALITGLCLQDPFYFPFCTEDNKSWLYRPERYRAHIYMHVYIHIYVNVYIIHIYIYIVCIHACMDACTYVRIPICKRQVS